MRSLITLLPTVLLMMSSGMNGIGSHTLAHATTQSFTSADDTTGDLTVTLQSTDTAVTLDGVTVEGFVYFNLASSTMTLPSGFTLLVQNCNLEDDVYFASSTGGTGISLTLNNANITFADNHDIDGHMYIGGAWNDNSASEIHLTSDSSINIWRNTLGNAVYFAYLDDASTSGEITSSGGSTITVSDNTIARELWFGSAEGTSSVNKLALSGSSVLTVSGNTMRELNLGYADGSSCQAIVTVTESSQVIFQSNTLSQGPYIAYATGTSTTCRVALEGSSSFLFEESSISSSGYIVFSESAGSATLEATDSTFTFKNNANDRDFYFGKADATNQVTFTRSTLTIQDVTQTGGEMYIAMSEGTSSINTFNFVDSSSLIVKGNTMEEALYFGYADSTGNSNALTFTDSSLTFESNNVVVSGGDSDFWMGYATDGGRSDIYFTGGRLSFINNIVSGSYYIQKEANPSDGEISAITYSGSCMELYDRPVLTFVNTKDTEFRSKFCGPTATATLAETETYKPTKTADLPTPAPPTPVPTTPAPTTTTTTTTAAPTTTTTAAPTTTVVTTTMATTTTSTASPSTTTTATAGTGESSSINSDVLFDLSALGSGAGKTSVLSSLLFCVLALLAFRL